MYDGETQANCTCNYPDVICKNMNGHDPSCPVYQAWWREFRSEFAVDKPAPPATPNPLETIVFTTG